MNFPATPAGIVAGSDIRSARHAQTTPLTRPWQEKQVDTHDDTTLDHGALIRELDSPRPAPAFRSP